ncbi:ABC transporter ATP-binding protein [uncultured Desulfovibrio sp.]|uniref:ABC transporter ATP-binding protein n=1 Tax=Candidatus Desulfovibrio intestinavium TaxID=2838534 RepID=A0A9D2KSA4_9BACT|nr:ABC transporter ATP-binding protein [uncultured Desulfovibrio sp.]HJA79231.1 ABC transporter ATP-binding protein [Candidatus Desulfovibrio intestinavium]
MLSCTNLHAGYPGREVLHGISLHVAPGESVALLGHNGSGKTTLLRVLCGQIAPTSGSVLLGGSDPAALSVRERARRVAVVPQRAEFFSSQIVRDMVLLGRYAHLGWWGAYSAHDYAVADAALHSAGAHELAERRMGELSGGEVQRVMLARALAQESPVLLLDELAAALDWARVVELFDLLEQRRRAGAAIVMAVHDCSLAAQYATRLVGLRQGRMLFDGPAQTVFTEENLSALYHLPLCVFAHPRNGLPQALPACPRGPHHAGEGESPPPPPAPAPEAAVPDAEPRPVDPADPARRS